MNDNDRTGISPKLQGALAKLGDVDSEESREVLQSPFLVPKILMDEKRKKRPEKD